MARCRAGVDPRPLVVDADVEGRAPTVGVTVVEILAGTPAEPLAFLADPTALAAAAGFFVTGGSAQAGRVGFLIICPY